MSPLSPMRPDSARRRSATQHTQHLLLLLLPFLPELTSQQRGHFCQSVSLSVIQSQSTTTVVPCSLLQLAPRTRQKQNRVALADRWWLIGGGQCEQVRGVGGGGGGRRLGQVCAREMNELVVALNHGSHQLRLDEGGLVGEAAHLLGVEERA